MSFLFVLERFADVILLAFLVPFSSYKVRVWKGAQRIGALLCHTKEGGKISDSDLLFKQYFATFIKKM